MKQSSLRPACADYAKVAEKLRQTLMKNLFDLTSKTALITGSSQGIGKQVALQMALHGANVVISSRKEDACIATAKEVNGITATTDAGRATAIPCHVGYKDQLNRLVEETNEKLGDIDILVCNAAVNPFYGSMLDIPDGAFEKILDCNIKSNHWLCQIVLPQMVKNGDGAIIMMSSIGGLYGHSTLGTYSLSKAADMQLARNIAIEYGPHNIRANAIAPGLIQTNFSRKLWEHEEALESATGAVALRRIGQPNEIAGAAVFLASSAGSYITGQTLVIDGGMMGL
jgi:NAD(P)-dependent dehydrogenase (short-subunit alcohol dehydrogenase family)